MKYVSLGCCCEISYLTKYFETDGCSPFDWITSDNYCDIIDCIHTNFEHFMTNKYEFTAPHYSFEGFRDKSIRRIQRFQKILNSSEPRLFIRKNHFELLFKDKSKAMTMDECQTLYNAISKYNPNHRLLVVNEHPKIIENGELFYGIVDREPVINVQRSGNIVLVNTYDITSGCNFDLGDEFWTQIIQHL